MFLETSCRLLAYGRPAMILSAYASPMPGSATSSSLDAEFRSTLAESEAFASVAVLSAVVPLLSVAGALLDFLVVAAVELWAAANDASRTSDNRLVNSLAIFLFIFFNPPKGTKILPQTDFPN